MLSVVRWKANFWTKIYFLYLLGIHQVRPPIPPTRAFVLMFHAVVMTYETLRPAEFRLRQNTVGNPSGVFNFASIL